jgi:hypothetical protein
MQRLGAPQQVHRRDKPDEPIKMVTVQMADKDIFNALKMDMHPPERNLGALATVEQEKLFAMVEQLSRRVTFRGRGSRTATEYDKVKRKHLRIRLSVIYKAAKIVFIGI